MSEHDLTTQLASLELTIDKLNQRLDRYFAISTDGDERVMRVWVDRAGRPRRLLMHTKAHKSC